MGICGARRNDNPLPVGNDVGSQLRQLWNSRPGPCKAEGRDTWVDRTAAVASFPPNAFGLHDMHGNVFEWVEDCYEADFANAPADGTANKQGNCANRVFRDGTFLSNPYMHRSARRCAPYPATRRGRNYLGFRVAKTLD
jgi:formylglycine-generating enzyme required for sulfatase activity